VSRTGRPSLALRHAARVLTMHPFQWQRLLAADAFARGNTDDQKGAYSDDDDEEEEDDEEGFGGFAPMTVEEVWDGAAVGGAPCLKGV